MTKSGASAPAAALEEPVRLGCVLWPRLTAIFS
jgi:hypothetical protein